MFDDMSPLNDMHSKRIAERIKSIAVVDSVKEVDELRNEIEKSISDDGIRNAATFMHFDIGVLVAYLNASHDDYRKVFIPSIVTSFNQLIENASDCMLLQKMGPYLVYGFKEDAIAHFQYEEDYLFPYALQIDQNHVSNNYSTAQFEEDHPNHVVDIEKLLLFFSMLKEELNGFMSYRILMKRLNILKREFDLHGLIEDEILIPKIQELE